MTINIIGGVETVVCLSGFNAYIDTCYGNKDILFLNSDEGIGCNIHIEDINEIYINEFMEKQIYIEMGNGQMVQIWSENNDYYCMECNQD